MKVSDPPGPTSTQEPFMLARLQPLIASIRESFPRLAPLRGLAVVIVAGSAPVRRMFRRLRDGQPP